MKLWGLAVFTWNVHSVTFSCFLKTQVKFQLLLSGEPSSGQGKHKRSFIHSFNHGHQQKPLCPPLGWLSQAGTWDTAHWADLETEQKGQNSSKPKNAPLRLGCHTPYLKSGSRDLDEDTTTVLIFWVIQKVGARWAPKNHLPQSSLQMKRLGPKGRDRSSSCPPDAHPAAP